MWFSFSSSPACARFTSQILPPVRSCSLSPNLSSCTQTWCRSCMHSQHRESWSFGWDEEGAQGTPTKSPRGSMEGGHWASSRSHRNWQFDKFLLYFDLETSRNRAGCLSGVLDKLDTAQTARGQYCYPYLATEGKQAAFGMAERAPAWSL